MKKRILSCLMALALCLTLLPTAALAEETEGTAQTPPAVEKAADPANGEAKQENQSAEAKQEGQSAEAKQESQSAEAKQESQPAEVKQESQPAEVKQENQPAEQEEQQEDSAAKQAVAAVQAMIDALPDAADLDGMDDAEAMEVYEAFQTACEAYYDTLSEKQREQLKNTEKLEALSERFSQLETLAAGDTHTHFLCGGADCNGKGHKKEETATTFDKWLASSSSGKYALNVGGKGSSSETGGDGLNPVGGKYVLPDGSYYLKTGDGFDSDVTIEHPIQITGNVTICLNGKTIQNRTNDQPVFEVVSGGKLTLTDCKNNNKGKVTRAYNSHGGGVYVTGGQFTMYGGSITKNTAEKDSKNKGGNGGGVYVGGGTFDMNGNASVSGNKATNSKSENTTYGGGVYVSGTKSTFTMNGNASVSGNTAANGGGVSVNSRGTFNMNGNASITGNTANGVFVNGGTFTVSGEPTVTGNTGKSGREDDVSNVYLAGGDTITIGGKLDAGASIGVTKGAGGVNSVIATGANKNYSGKFFVDDNKYKVGYDETHKQLVLAEKDTSAETHTHCLCGKTHTAIGDHKTEQEVTFATELKQVNGQLTMGSQPWSAKSITINGSTPNCYVLPAGSYYLGSDLALDASIYISENVQLCLNGNSIISNGDNVGRNVVIVDTDSSDVFTLANCRNGGSITHATGKNGCGVYMNGNRTKFNMYGGIITGNNSGGVNVTQTNTFNMYGGKITGNSAGFGGGVYNGGTVNIYGGEISDNTASNKGGGVYMAASMGNYQGGILNVSGAAKITDNKVNGVANNVYLPANKTITIGEGGLSGQIGVTTEPKPAAGTPVTVIASIGSNTGLATHVVSDDNAYATAVKGSTIVLKVKGDGGTTPAGKPDPKYTPPTAKTGLVYNGTARVLINEGSVEGGQMQYSLERNGAYSPYPPIATNAGIYTVYYKVVGDASHNNVAEQSLTVWIEKAPLSGTPAYTLITSTGKTLADANLTAGDIKPENGQIKWVDENGVELAVSTEVKANTAYRWKFTPDDTSNYEELTGSITLYPVSTGGGGSSGGGGGSSSDRDSSDSNPVIKTETKTNTDGSTTKTETRRDGSVTQTTTGKDGSVSKTETKPDGSSVTENKAADGSTGTVKTDKNGQTEAAAKVSGKAVEDAKKNGEAVKAPVEVEASRNSSTAPTVKVELPKNSGETKVEIPVSNVKSGTVAVLVHPDGTEEILKDSIPTEDGIRLTVDGNATVKIVDNSKGFIDTRNHWAEDEIDFVSARGLVNGMSATIYAPNNSTTRAQLWTILARQNDANLNGGSVWYEKAQNWAKSEGVSDGANPNAAINRAQMVTMLWRAVGQPVPATAATFTDVPADAYYAGAVSWAVENGITTGVGGGKFDPTATCTRAQIAAFLTRLYAEK